MPDKYLTYSHMNMLAALLKEALEADFLPDNEIATEAARQLIKNIEAGLVNKDALRYLLKRHLKVQYIPDTEITRWEGEGGAIT